MATLQAGEKARMYALGKIARGGATRGGYVSARAFIAIDGVHVGFGGTPGAGHVGTIIDSLTITDALNDAANTCQFRINGMVPAAGAEVKITLGSKNRVGALFAGFALSVQQGYAADKPANINADVSCVDYTWLFAFVKVTKQYRSQSASSIAADLVATYAAANGFTSRGVAPNLPSLAEITYTNEELDQAMTRLAERIGAYWYVDYQKDVHFFLQETLNGAPETLTAQHKSLANVRRSADRTQVLTRVYVEGRGTSILGAVAPGDTLIPLESIDMFEAAPDVMAKIAPHGSSGAAELITFTDVIPGGAGSLVGPGVGPPGPPAVLPMAGTGLGQGQYQYAYTDLTAAGETTPSPLATVALGAIINAPPSAPGLSPQLNTAGVDPGTHMYAFTYTGGGGETPAGPTAICSTQNPLSYGPGNGIYGHGLPNGGALSYWTYYAYKATFTANVGETTALPLSIADILINVSPSIQRTILLNLQVDASNAVTMRLYRAQRDPSVPGPYGPYQYIGEIPATTLGVYTFTDLGNVAPGATIPTVATAVITTRQINVSTPQSANASVTGAKIYRSRANQTSPLLFLAAVSGPRGAVSYTDLLADASLGAATPPTSNTALDTFRAVAVSNVAPGPSGTTGRRIYRTAVNAAQLKALTTLANNTGQTFTDTIADASLGANAPGGDTSGFTQPAGQVAAGSTSIILANRIPFEAGGGWAVIGNGEQLIRYTGKSATALTGIPATGVGAIVAAVAYNSTITAAPMLVGIPTTGLFAILEDLTAGDEIYLVVKREDAARQTALATMIKVGPGWREEWIQDRRLALAEARARGDATLALRPLEDVTLTYTCRDLRTASGKTITVDLPAPTNLAGTFKIQSVTIGNFRPFPTQYPTFNVTASSSMFSFEDWLRQMQTKV